MSQVLHTWKKISLKLFFPEKKRMLFWALMGPMLLLFSSVVLTLHTAPLPSILMVMGIFLLVTFYFAPPKISNFAFLGVALFSLFCLKAGERGFTWFDFFWNVQYLTSLFVAQKMILSAKEYILDRVDSLKSLEEDKELWKSRFDTLREKIESDREVWEKEIEVANEEAKEKVAYAESLRRLVETAHTTIRQLEESRSDVDGQSYDQTALLQNQRESIVSCVDAMSQMKLKDEEIASLKSKIQEASSQAPAISSDDAAAEIAFLKEELEHAKESEREVIALQKKLSQAEANSKKATKVAKLEEKLSLALEESKEAQKRLKSTKEEAETARIEMEKLALALKESQEAQGELKSVKEEAEATKAQMERLAEENKELEALLEESEKSDPYVIEGKEMGADDVVRVISELNEAREQNYQLEILLSDAKEKLEELQSAVESRRNRNQQLLKTNADKPITLQGLAKKAKR